MPVGKEAVTPASTELCLCAECPVTPENGASWKRNGGPGRTPVQ